ncbi:MAG: hypothetical protein IJW15_01735 [Clostridia bacterium]|nr:hypothetical protein [Clostridia bacterium]
MLFAIITFVILIALVIIRRAELVAFFARMKFQRGDLEGALRLHSIANRIGKLRDASLMYYGYLLLRDGQLELARDILTRASLCAKKPPMKKRIKAMLAIAEWKSGDLDTAIEMTEEAMVDFKTTNLYQNLGLMYVLKGDARRALDFNKEAFEYNSDDMIIMDNLAESYALYGDTEKASELYEKLLLKEPHFPEPYYGYGQLLVKKGEKERGLELIEKSLEKKFTFLSVLQKDEVEKILAKIKEV